MLSKSFIIIKRDGRCEILTQHSSRCFCVPIITVNDETIAYCEIIIGSLSGDAFQEVAVSRNIDLHAQMFGCIQCIIHCLLTSRECVLPDNTRVTSTNSVLFPSYNGQSTLEHTFPLLTFVDMLLV